jgi:hypothetical protein
MKPLAFTRANDLLAPAAPANNELTISLAPLTGVWNSTNEETRGIVKLILSDSDGILLVQCFGAGGLSLIDWETIHGEAFAGTVGTTDSVGFKASYDFGFLQTRVAAYLNKRILVVDTYNTFKDNSGRANYFMRDHFYQ